MYIQVVLQAQEIVQPASASTGQQPSKPAAQVSGCCAVQRCRALHWHGITPAAALHLVQDSCTATTAAWKAAGALQQLM